MTTSSQSIALVTRDMSNLISLIHASQTQTAHSCHYYTMSQKKTTFNAPLLYNRESQSHAVFTKMFRNYLIMQKRAKFDQCHKIFYVQRLVNELLKKHQYSRHFQHH